MLPLSGFWPFSFKPPRAALGGVKINRSRYLIHICQSMFSENLVEFVDILPTLVEASGLPELDKCPVDSRDIAICREGTSLLRISEGHKIIYSY